MPVTVPDLVTTSQSAATAIATRLPGADATPPRSPLGVLAKVMSGAVDGLYGLVQTVAANIIYDSASIDYLVRWAAIWGLAQEPPTPATGLVIFTGASSGTLSVLAGTVLTRSDGLQYVLAETVVLVNGSGVGSVTCTSAGAVTNTAAGGTLNLTSTVPGVATSVTVGAGGLADGNDIETPQALLARLLLRIQQKPQGGSIADYIEWASGCAGVTRAWVFPAWQGTGTVGVAFMMDTRANPVPQGADVAAVQTMLTVARPVAAPTFVFAPTAQPLNPVIHLVTDSAAIRAAVTASLASLVATVCVPGGAVSTVNNGLPASGTLPLTQIEAAISAAAGVTDFVLSVPAATVTVPKGTIITLGTITWV